MSSDHLPIAITATADKEFDGWYNSEDKLMSASDLVNVNGHETWTAKFIDIEPTSVHVNFSVGSTNGIDSVPLEDVALTVGGASITAKESANGFILGGTTYLDPTLSLQAASTCKAPIGVTGSVSGYNVLGTFLTTDKLDVDNTEQLETGEFFVGLESKVSNNVTFNTTDNSFIIDGEGFATNSLTLTVPLNKFPFYFSNLAASHSLTGFTDGEKVITSPGEVEAGKTYTPVYDEIEGPSRITFSANVGISGTKLSGSYKNLIFGNGNFGATVTSVIGRARFDRVMFSSDSVQIPNLTGFQGITSSTSVCAETDSGVKVITDFGELSNYSSIWFN